MSKQSGYIKRLAAQQKVHNDFVRDHMRTMVCDIFTIALNKYGIPKEDMPMIRDLYLETEHEYFDEIRDSLVSIVNRIDSM